MKARPRKTAIERDDEVDEKAAKQASQKYLYGPLILEARWGACAGGENANEHGHFLPSPPGEPRFNSLRKASKHMHNKINTALLGFSSVSWSAP